MSSPRAFHEERIEMPTECPRCRVTSERRPPDGSCPVCGERAPTEGEASTRATQEAHATDEPVKEPPHRSSEESNGAVESEAEIMAFEQLQRAACSLAYTPIADVGTVARQRERLRAAARCYCNATAVDVEPKHAEITLEPGEGIAELTRSILRLANTGVSVVLQPREAKCIAAWITGITAGQIKGHAPHLPAGWTLADALHSLRMIADLGEVGAAWPAFSHFLVAEVSALKDLLALMRKRAERTEAIEGAMGVARRHLDDAIARLAAEATGLERLQLEGVARALGRARATLDDSTSSEAPSASYEAQLKAELGEHLAAAVATDEERTDPVKCPDELATGTCSHEGCRARRERVGQ
jgi:hypothetical protein